MSADLKLKTNAEPSFFNKDMLLGALIGALAIGPLGLIGVAIAATATVIGGFVGKNRMEHEKREGKTVGEPSFWNKDTAIGGLIGLFGAGIAAFSAGMLTAGAGIAIGVGAPVVTGVALAAVGAALIGSPLIGGYIGGIIGKNRQAHEYEEAKRQTIVEHLSSTVSPEVGKAVEYSMEHGKDWSKGVAEDRLLAAAQQRNI